MPRAVVAGQTRTRPHTAGGRGATERRLGGARTRHDLCGHMDGCPRLPVLAGVGECLLHHKVQLRRKAMGRRRESAREVGAGTSGGGGGREGRAAELRIRQRDRIQIESVMARLWSRARACRPAAHHIGVNPHSWRAVDGAVGPHVRLELGSQRNVVRLRLVPGGRGRQAAGMGMTSWTLHINPSSPSPAKAPIPPMHVAGNRAAQFPSRPPPPRTATAARPKAPLSVASELAPATFNLNKHLPPVTPLRRVVEHRPHLRQQV